MSDQPLTMSKEREAEIRARCGVTALLSSEVEPLLRELDATRAALAQATTWQPMESAPKDGTNILAWLATWEMPAFVNWRVGRSGIAMWNDAVEHDNEMDGSDAYSHPPTHWLPLPAPPKPTTQGDTP